MNIINVNNNAAAAAASSSFVSNLSMPVIEPTGVYPVTPSKVKSKLNPRVEAFTLYDNNFKSSVTAMNTQKEESIPPHLRHLSKVSSEEDPVITTEEQSVKDKIKDQDPFAASAEKESAKENEPLQATSLTPRILPHLRRPITVITNEDIHPSQAQRSGNDKLFEINPSGSPKAGEKKTVPLPPGFIPISTKDAIVNTETAAPNKTREAASLTAAHDLITYRNPTAKGEEAAPGREISVKPTSEKEISAAFVAEYGKRISSLSEKYGRESSDAAKVDWSYAVKYEGAAPVSPPYLRIGSWVRILMKT